MGSKKNTVGSGGGGPGAPRGPSRKEAEQAFRRFLERNRVTVGEISEENLSESDMIASKIKIPDLTDFLALDDTFLYSILLWKMVRLYSAEVRRIIDLGAGSSIPTINALLDNQELANPRVVAVDRDPQAVEIGRRNVGRFGLAGNYKFVEGDMMEFLRATRVKSGDAVVANPPYLPVPRNLRKKKYLNINGGMNGVKYIRAILEHPMPSGTLVGIQWSSLSDPMAVLDMIEKDYHVVHVEAHRAPFGTYTGSPELKPHLLSQRERGKAVFTTDDDGRHEFCFVGSILRRR